MRGFPLISRLLSCAARFATGRSQVNVKTDNIGGNLILNDVWVNDESHLQEMTNVTLRRFRIPFGGAISKSRVRIT